MRTVLPVAGFLCTGRLRRLAALLLLLASVVSPQAANPGGDIPAQPVIRVDVNLRQVDLTVTDAKGNHVNDLQASDFLLLEDGKPQRIANFSWVEVTPPPSGSRLALLNEKPSVWERFTGLPKFHKTPGNDILSAPAANLRKEEIRRMIAIVAQGGVAPFNTTPMARVRKFVDEQVGPGDMVSIRSTGRRMISSRDGKTVLIRDSSGIFGQFTNDKRQLDAATERLPRVCMYRGDCTFDAVGAITAAIRDLQDLPGRKALLYVGTYFGPVESIVGMANRAGVVIYMLDPFGIESPIGSARMIAERTGGRRIASTVGFDLTKSFNEVIEDLSGYYLLGYYTALDDPNPAPKKPVRHNVEIRVLRPGLIVRARDGRLGKADREVRPAADLAARPASGAAAQPAGREDILTKALFSVYTQDGIRLRLAPAFAASAPDSKGKRKPVIRAAIDIDGRDVELTQSDGDRLKAALDVVLAVFNGDGTQAGAANNRYTFSVPKSRVTPFVQTGAHFNLHVPVAGPGPYQVRAAVRDPASGEIGSAYAFLDIPDFNRSQISLSSMALSLADGLQPATAARADWNEFAPAAAVRYSCEVFGLRTPGRPPAAPKVEAEVKLYRGGGPAAEIPLAPVEIGEAEGRLTLTGAMRIPDNLAPGNYMMELLAYDRLQRSRSKQVARQWTDISVVGPKE